MLQGLWHTERGFTFVELMVTILIMGILAAIAMSFWWNVVDSRRVDSATNQLAADMRLAHTTATNRLAPQEVSLVTGSSEYSMTGAPFRDLDEDPDQDVTIVDNMIVDGTVTSPVTITFCSNGSVVIPPSLCSPPGPPITIEVRSAADNDPCHEIEVNTVTSRIEISPYAC
jgi:prepilin-type N-terminal cleavage/methylation domain-containing protein